MRHKNIKGQQCQALVELNKKTLKEHEADIRLVEELRTNGREYRENSVIYQEVMACYPIESIKELSACDLQSFTYEGCTTQELLGYLENYEYAINRKSTPKKASRYTGPNGQNRAWDACRPLAY